VEELALYANVQERLRKAGIMYSAAHEPSCIPRNRFEDGSFSAFLPGESRGPNSGECLRVQTTVFRFTSFEGVGHALWEQFSANASGNQAEKLSDYIVFAPGSLQGTPMAQGVCRIVSLQRVSPILPSVEMPFELKVPLCAGIPEATAWILASAAKNPSHVRIPLSCP